MSKNPSSPATLRIRAGLLLCGLTFGAQAATITVNTTSMSLANDAKCGFREAILAVNGGGQMWGCPGGDGIGDAISLPSGTYTAPAAMDITKSVFVSCIGPGACNIEAGSFTGALFTVTGGNAPGFALSGLTLRQPAAIANAVTGVLVESGNLNLTDVTVTGFKMNGLVITAGTSHEALRATITNNATSGVFLSPGAALFINYSTLSGNTQNAFALSANASLTSAYNTISGSGQAGVGLSQGADFYDYGSTVANNTGAGFDGAGDVHLNHTVVRGNKNGGIRLDGGFAEIAYCAIEYNTTSGNGGGVSILVPGNVTVNSSTISNNKAGGNGGGFYMTGGGNFYHTTVSNDTATNGGGLYHNPGGSGGGAYIEMYQATIAFNRATNSGGGVYPISGSSPFRTFGCIVAQNSAPTNPDVSGFINSSNTMYSNVTGFTGVHTSDYFPFNPLLGPLMDNAGPQPLKTHALLKGSPALDKINTPGSVAAFDERGFPRPAAGLWDLGSYEAGPFETELLTVIGKSSDEHTIQTESGLSNGQGTLLRADAAGDYVTYAVAIPEIGSYSIAVRVKAGPNRGIYELASAPGNNSYTAIGSLDLYKSGLQFTTLPALTMNFTQTGIKYFRFKLTGKNAASTGNLGYFDYIKLTKQ